MTITGLKPLHLVLAWRDDLTKSKTTLCGQPNRGGKRYMTVFLDQVERAIWSSAEICDDCRRFVQRTDNLTKTGEQS